MTWEDENLYQDYFDRGLECANPPAPRSCQVPIAGEPWSKLYVQPMCVSHLLKWVTKDKHDLPQLFQSLGEAFSYDSFDWGKASSNGLFNKCMPCDKKHLPTAGRILSHAKKQVTALREKIGIRICIFKVGVTSNPPVRFANYLAEGFTTMWVVSKHESLNLTHMLEAALISEFHQHVGCRNRAESGGDGSMHRFPPPYFCSVVAGRADQPRWVG